jgi:hypothetical protein
VKAIVPALPKNLGAVRGSDLPALYKNAKTALAECWRVDECKAIKDRAIAMAVYAKQAKDEAFMKVAVRIQDRAIRRLGELLQEIEPSKGGRPREHWCPEGCDVSASAPIWHCEVCDAHQGFDRPECHYCHEGEAPRQKPGRETTRVSRSEAAEDAGLSPHQKKQALRVAAVPKADFDRAVESDDPPTATELAKRGTKAQPKPAIDLGGRDPKDVEAATPVLARIRDMRVMAQDSSPAAVVRGAFADERTKLGKDIPIVIEWLNLLQRELEEAA